MTFVERHATASNETGSVVQELAQREDPEGNSKRVVVYIAAPYTTGNMDTNVSRAVCMWHLLWDLGYYPVCPHLSFFLHFYRPRTYEEWMEYDEEILCRSDVLFRMIGQSPGADREISISEECDIPVVYTLRQLVQDFPVRVRDGKILARVVQGDCDEKEE